MSSLVSQTTVFRLKEGVDLNVVGATLKDLAKSGGFLNSYWGSQVENPGLFVWVFGFESLHHRNEFLSSEAYSAFSSTSPQFFDTQPDQPKFATKWAGPISEVNEAMAAPITEIAFFTLATSKMSLDDAKKAVEEGMEWILMAVKKFGKAKGAAVGWVLNNEEATLSGVFGYGCLEDHMEWRTHPEHANAGKIFIELEEKGLSLRPDMRVWGVDSQTGYFHVKYQSA